MEFPCGIQVVLSNVSMTHGQIWGGNKKNKIVCLNRELSTILVGNFIIDLMCKFINPNAYHDCFTLWPKFKRPSISTNQIARNQELGLSSLHIRGQSPKVIALWNAYMALLFDQCDGLSKGVWDIQEWKTKLWSRDRQFLFIKIKNKLK